MKPSHVILLICTLLLVPGAAEALSSSPDETGWEERRPWPRSRAVDYVGEAHAYATGYGAALLGYGASYGGALVAYGFFMEGLEWDYYYNYARLLSERATLLPLWVGCAVETATPCGFPDVPNPPPRPQIFFAPPMPAPPLPPSPPMP